MKRGGTAFQRAQEGRSGLRLPGSVGQMMWAAAATIIITIVIRKASKDFVPIAHRTIQRTRPAMRVRMTPISARSLARQTGGELLHHGARRGRRILARAGGLRGRAHEPRADDHAVCAGLGGPPPPGGRGYSET